MEPVNHSLQLMERFVENTLEQNRTTAADVRADLREIVVEMRQQFQRIIDPFDRQRIVQEDNFKALSDRLKELEVKKSGPPPPSLHSPRSVSFFG